MAKDFEKLANVVLADSRATVSYGELYSFILGVLKIYTKLDGSSTGCELKGIREIVECDFLHGIDFTQNIDRLSSVKGKTELNIF